MGSTEPIGALCRGRRTDLLQYPVTVAEALGLWSFISGGIVRGARERLNTESGDERHERRMDDWWKERKV